MVDAWDQARAPRDFPMGTVEVLVADAYKDLWDALNPDAYDAEDLRLMPSVDDASDLPTEGKNLVIVADVGGVLHFRSFDRDGRIVMDTDETRLTPQAGPIADLKKRLENLWPLQQVWGLERSGVLNAVESIVVHTPYNDSPGAPDSSSGLDAEDTPNPEAELTGWVRRLLNDLAMEAMPDPADYDPLDSWSLANAEHTEYERTILFIDRMFHTAEFPETLRALESALTLFSLSDAEDAPGPKDPRPAAAAPRAATEDEIAAVLEEKGWAFPAALVKLMVGEQKVSFNDVALKVHGNTKTSDTTIRKNIYRLNMLLEGMGSTIHYRTRGGYVRKLVDPE
jgi:hypothetical protein